MARAAWALRGVTGSTAGLVAMRPNRRWPVGTPLVAIVVRGDDARTLASARAQTWRDVEIVQAGQGSSKGAALNAAVATTRAKYVVCLDAGDVIAPTYVQKALMLQEMFATPTLVVPSAAGQHYNAFNAHTMLHHNSTAPVSMFRRADWQAAGGFSEIGDDATVMWDFTLRLLAAGVKSHVMAEVLYTPPAVAPTVDMEAQRAALRAAHPNFLDYGYCARLMARWSFDYHRNPFLNIAPREPVREGRSVLFMMTAPVTGGAERIIAQVAARMKYDGWRVIVVSVQPPPAGYAPRDDVFADCADEYYNLSRLVPQTFWGEFFDHLVATRGVETVFGASVLFLYSHAVKLRARFPRLRLIDFPFIPEDGAMQYARHVRGLFDASVIESAVGAEVIESTGVPRSTIAVIPNGVDVQKFSPAARSAAFRQQFGNTEPLIVGFCARLSPEKNVESLVTIARHFANDARVQFVVAGDGPMAPVVQALAQQQANVYAVGAVANLHLFLPNFDVLLLPSISEGRPNVMLESLACGTPVLGSTAGAIPEVIQNGITGWCYHSSDTAAFIAKIEELLATRAALDAMRPACRRYAEEHLNRDVMLQHYADLIAGVQG